MFRVRLFHYGSYTDVFMFGCFSEVDGKACKFGLPYKILDN